MCEVFGRDVADFITEKFQQKFLVSMSGHPSTHAQAVANVRQQFPQAAPVEPQQASVSAIPQCQHGPRTNRRGVGKSGKPYNGWVCPLAQSDPNKCEPIWM